MAASVDANNGHGINIFMVSIQLSHNSAYVANGRHGFSTYRLPSQKGEPIVWGLNTCSVFSWNHNCMPDLDHPLVCSRLFSRSCWTLERLQYLTTRCVLRNCLSFLFLFSWNSARAAWPQSTVTLNRNQWLTAWCERAWDENVKH